VREILRKEKKAEKVGILFLKCKNIEKVS